MAPVIEVDGVTQRAGHAVLFAGISFQLHAGMHVLIGPSGAGKTTLLRLLLGLTAPDSGAISIAGRVVTRARSVIVPPEDRGVAMVFQDLGLWPDRTVEEHLLLVLGARGVARAKRRDRTARTLTALGLERLARRRPNELSGGERQRVALARALVGDPAVLLLDEPLSSLDIVLQERLVELLVDLVEQRGLCALYVAHDPQEARSLLRARPTPGLAAVLLVEPGSFTVAASVDELRDGESTFGRAFAGQTAR